MVTTATVTMATQPVAEKPAVIPEKKMTPEEQRRLIAERAYLKAEKRGFAPGSEEADWLAAEQEIQSQGDFWW